MRAAPRVVSLAAKVADGTARRIESDHSTAEPRAEAAAAKREERVLVERLESRPRIAHLGEHDPASNGVPAGAGGGGVGSTGAGGKTKTKGGTNVDTIIGKIVVDQGLATPEEVQACLEQARATSLDGNSKSLPLLLVENDFITRRQLERIKAQADYDAALGSRTFGLTLGDARAQLHTLRQLVEHADRALPLDLTPPAEVWQRLRMSPRPDPCLPSGRLR